MNTAAYRAVLLLLIIVLFSIQATANLLSPHLVTEVSKTCDTRKTRRIIDLLATGAKVFYFCGFLCFQAVSAVTLRTLYQNVIHTNNSIELNNPRLDHVQETHAYLHWAMVIEK